MVLLLLVLQKKLRYQGQATGSKIIHNFVCPRCGREYKITTERLLNPSRVTIISKPGRPFSSLGGPKEELNYPELRRFFEKLNAGSISESEINSYLETGVLDPFELPFALYQAFGDEGVNRIWGSAMDIITKRYERLIVESSQQLEARTLILCDGRIIYANKSTSQVEPTDEELKSIEKRLKRLCFSITIRGSEGIG